MAFVGRVDEPRKGLAVLLEALPQIAAEHPGARLFVAGPGELADELPADLVERVTVLGRVSEEDKAALLSSVDLYVAPHLGGESFGIVLLEAMSSRCPVLASNLVAFRDVLDDGRSGELFTTGDPTALARAASSLLSDRDRRRELAQRGFERAQGYDWSRIARQVLAVYETVCVAGEKVREDDRQGPGLFAGRLRRSPGSNGAGVNGAGSADAGSSETGRRGGAET
jgi:phosphatidylinositol alpha-mannosyltransferase